MYVYMCVCVYVLLLCASFMCISILHSSLHNFKIMRKRMRGFIHFPRVFVRK